MRNDEKTLFIKLCSFLDADEEALAGLLNENATPAVLGQLFFNRMQGAAYETLRKSGLLGAVSREFRNALKGAWEQNCQRNESFYTAVKLLSELLAGKEGKYAMLKGAVLCGKYPNGCRTSNDIDLLLLPEHITELGDVLEAAGFRQGEIKSGAFVPATRREIIASRMMRGETVPYILELRLPMMQYLEVDLNFSLDYKNSGTDTLKKMLSQTEQISVGNTPLQTLCEEDFFLHLCGHLYKEAATLPLIQMKRDMTLYKYCDIYMLMRRMTERQITRLMCRAEALHMLDILCFAILQTAELFASANCIAVQRAAKAMLGREAFLHTVISPKDRKTLRYTEPSVWERFFSEDRTALLEEVN